MLTRTEFRSRCDLLDCLVCETPIKKLEVPEVELHTVLEFQNGIGSVKDRPALWVVRAAIERGEIGPDTTIIESSSGNFALALASYAKMLGLDFIPVIDPNISGAYEGILRSLCRRVEKVTVVDDTGGYLKSRLSKIEELRSRIPNAFWTNQYGNLDAVEAHYVQTAGQICRTFRSLDFMFIAVSTGGTIAGVSTRLKEEYPNVKIVAVDVEGSVIFGGPSTRRYISGMGSSIVPPLLERANIDEVMILSEEETIRGCRELLQKHKLFVGGSSGTVYWAIRRYFADNSPSHPPKVAFLCCDRGTPYLSTVFNPEWAEWRVSQAKEKVRGS